VTSTDHPNGVAVAPVRAATTASADAAARPGDDHRPSPQPTAPSAAAHRPRPTARPATAPSAARRRRAHAAVAAAIVLAAVASPADATAGLAEPPVRGALSSTPAPTGTAPLVCVVDGGVRPVAAIGGQLVLSDVLAAVAGLLDPGDDHGTMVAEAVLATWPWARIASVRVLQGGAADGALVPRAVDRCVALGAAVVNVSVVSPAPQPQAVIDAMRAAVLRARDAGTDVVVAAGNAGGPVLFPGNAAPDVAYVVDATDGAARCAFTSTGPDVIVGAAACPTWLPAVDGSGWAPQAGTSFAAPQVAAALAAVRAYAPALDAAGRRAVIDGMPDRQLNPATVLRRIGRADLLPTTPGAVGPTTTTGPLDAPDGTGRTSRTAGDATTSATTTTARLTVRWRARRLTLGVSGVRGPVRLVVRRRGTTGTFTARRARWTVPRAVTTARAVLVVRAEDRHGTRLAGRTVRVPR
jgi:hypothetical protein